MRAYMWMPDKDDDSGVGIVADNVREAKKIGYEYWCREYIFENDFVDISCKWIKRVNIDGLEKGAVEWKEGLKRGIYSWVEDTCPICGQENIIYFYEDKNIIACSGCGEPDDM